MSKTDKTKLLFFHFDLGVGGAEKVLLNLINNLPENKYEITLCLLFKSGVRLKDLAPHIHLKYLFNRSPIRGITKYLQILSPRMLYRLAIRERFDIEIAYLEGIPARIISGSYNNKSKKFCWIHSDSLRNLHSCFRSEKEARKCYSKYDKIAFVADKAKEGFVDYLKWDRPVEVVRNVVDTKTILSQASQTIKIDLNGDNVNLCIVGRLHWHKSHERLIEALSKVTNRNWHLYIIGDGELKDKLTSQAKVLGIYDNISFLGFDANPYRYMSKMDAIVCSSVLEGYSTVAVESMVLGIPFITTDVSGMRQILEDEKSGLIVSNDVDGLTSGLDKFINDKLLRKTLTEGAKERGKAFSIQEGIRQFESFISE